MDPADPKTDELDWLDAELADTIDEEAPLPPERVVRIATQVCDALSEAHAAGIIHRDLKPENIMISGEAGEGESVKILDFGTAQILTAEPGSVGASGTDVVVRSFTPSNLVQRPQVKQPPALGLGRRGLYVVTPR